MFKSQPRAYRDSWGATIYGSTNFWLDCPKCEGFGTVFIPPLEISLAKEKICPNCRQTGTIPIPFSEIL